jgi:hypothetical protein
VWQDENGARIAECAAAYDDRLGRSEPPDRSHCLQYVDPVGDATFNQLQLPHLVRELEEVVAALGRLPEARQRQMREVLEFVRGCVGVHTYVRFIGD